MDVSLAAQDLKPIVVDLDGTLLKTDLLVESFLALLTTAPWHAVRALRHLRQGPAPFKAEIAEQVYLDFHTLPVNEELLAWLRMEKARGRRIFLASASTEPYVRAIADHIGLFDGIFASTPSHNLKGSAKAKLLCDSFGRGGFDYAGNAAVDMEVWCDADGVIVVNAGAKLVAEVRARFPQALVIAPRRGEIREYRRALRVHQWLKNLLLLIPALTAHHFDFGTLFVCLLAFFSFSLCASSVYILNDLLDLRNDREHLTKRLRPFAAGSVDLLHGLALFPATLLLALLIAPFLSWSFLGVLAGYYLITMAYSLYLKRQCVLDVVTLACLYGIRLLAGAAVIDVPISPWLLSFSLFLFLSLALVKRCSELSQRLAAGKGDPAGRGYRLSDLPVLQQLAAGSGCVAALTLVLYVESPAVAHLYRQPSLLWILPVVLLYWICRMLILTHRNEMHEDPVLFAAKDGTSWLCVGLMTLAVLVAV